jgi:chemotaxis response regulator CheB
LFGLIIGTNDPDQGFPIFGALEHQMTNRDIRAIGTSAGGVEALRFLAGEFSRLFPSSW